jgi:hypothetical protein
LLLGVGALRLRQGFRGRSASGTGVRFAAGAAPGRRDSGARANTTALTASAISTNQRRPCPRFAALRRTMSRA